MRACAERRVRAASLRSPEQRVWKRRAIARAATALRLTRSRVSASTVGAPQNAIAASNWARSRASTAAAPSAPPTHRPHSTGRPVITARAPSASALRDVAARADAAVDVDLGATRRPRRPPRGARRRSRRGRRRCARRGSTPRSPRHRRRPRARRRRPRSTPLTTTGSAAPLAEQRQVVEGDRRVEVRRPAP